MTDSELRDQAVAALKATTVSYPAWEKAVKAGKYNPKDGSKTQWGIAFNTLAQIGAAPPPPPPPPSSNYFWTAASYLKQRVAASPAQNPDSARMIAKLAAASPAGIYPNGQPDWSPTVYDAKNATTTARLTQTRDGTSTTIPWNPAWVPSPPPLSQGGDSQFDVVDYVSGDGWETEGFDPSNPNALKCQGFATFNILTQDGSSQGTNRVSVLPTLAGVVIPSDFEGDEILHALRCAIATASNQAIWPAYASDGNTSPDGIPSGSLLWLPRSVSLGQFGLDQYQTMLAVALQEFGMRVADSGGGTSIAFQSTADGVTKYPGGFVNGLPQSLLAKMVVLA